MRHFAGKQPSQNPLGFAEEAVLDCRQLESEWALDCELVTPYEAGDEQRIRSGLHELKDLEADEGSRSKCSPSFQNSAKFK